MNSRHGSQSFLPRRERRPRRIAASIIVLLVVSGIVAGTDAAAATATSDPKSHFAGAPGTPVSSPSVTVAAITPPVSVTPTRTPTPGPTVTVTATAARAAIAQRLNAPETPPAASMTATATMITTATATATVTDRAIIEPLAPASRSQGAIIGTPALAATTTPTPNPSTATPTIGTITATATAPAPPTPIPTATATVDATTVQPPRNLGLALIGPPMTIQPTAEEIANGGSEVIARVALRHLGEFTRPDGVPWVGWCEMFVGNVADEAGLFHTRFPSALTDSFAAPLFQGRAPVGSLVFFDQHSDVYGHVGIALGDGTMVSALGPGIVRTAYENWDSYVGWRPYPGMPTPYRAAATHLAAAVHAAIPEALAPAPTRGDEERDDAAHIEAEEYLPPCQLP